MRSPRHHHLASKPPSLRHGLARALSKLGYCSRSQAWELIQAGRVQVNGRVQRDPEYPVSVPRDHLQVNGREVRSASKVYVMLNKPRGLVTTTSDEQGRDTVYACLTDPRLPWLAPVGRLDKASEGLLLLTNDTEWSARITEPDKGCEKTYHVQINCVAEEALPRQLTTGVATEEGTLRAKRAEVLRVGTRNSWLIVVLDEGKNRHIRRLLAGLDIEVLRLIRVAIGPLELGDLAKGAFRHLTAAEVRYF